MTKITNRNAEVSKMLSNGKSLVNFYRIISQNPHLDLHTTCQIAIARPSANVCFGFNEWNAMGRRVSKGKKGIAYTDRDGNRNFLFDVNDTYGDLRYRRLAFSMKSMLMGLDELNNTSLYNHDESDYLKVQSGVESYFRENDIYTDDERLNKLLAQGVAYSLYAKTVFPKEKISIEGLPLSFEENAEIVKQVHKLTNLLAEEINDAYYRTIERVEVIDDTEEETLSDETTLEKFDVEDNKESVMEELCGDACASKDSSIQFTHTDYEDKKCTPYYQNYLEQKAKYPQAIAIIRLGDFYEIMGENAQTASNILDLVLTTRAIAENEKVSMCGFPYHVADSYIEKLSKENDVLVIETDNSIRLIENERTLEEKQNEQDYLDYINGELEFVEEEEVQEQENQPQENQPQENQPQENQPQENQSQENQSQENQPQEIKTNAKGLRDRKRKSGGKQSLFEFLGEQKSDKQQVIEFALKRGSNIIGGKVRIYEQYLTNPTAKDYASFLRDEYGTGGSATTGYSDQHNAKGISAEFKKDNGENIVIKLNWMEVANGVADLIDDNEYFSEKQWQEYLESKQVGEKQKSNEEQKSNDVNNDFEQEELEQEDIPQPPQDENTKLDLLEIESDLGGAKQRFKNNILAIKTVKRLEFENRSATAEEKTILAKYVGFGGLAQAFDEYNESWQKEYAELKSVLTADEYESAKGSVLNAHYTSQAVIKGIYNALTRFGVGKNNKILEPSMGTGNFFGFMPNGIAENAKLYGVELDSLTGRLAQKLYPGANIQIKGFEETSFSDNSFDVVVGNVPFGGYGVHDTDYNKHNFLIHDYFLAKSIDKLKTNGIMAVITSKGTLDKQNPQIRKYLADRAELVGAIRLPNTAFKKLAGTEAVTDILFFTKREEQINASGELWLGTGKTEDGFEINNYFIANPHMVLGTLAEERGLYGVIDVTVKDDGRDLLTAITNAVSTLPKGFYANPSIVEQSQELEEVEADYDVRPLCFKAENNKLYLRVSDKMIEQPISKNPKDAYQRISSMIELRNNLRHILAIQSAGCSDAKLKVEQSKLNYLYDNFKRKYGFINSQINTKLFIEDGDSALLFASEILSEDKKSAIKADVFSKRTIRPYTAPTETADCFEALQICKNERGKVDIGYVEMLTKKSFGTVVKELGNAVFRDPLEVSGDPYSGYITAEQYLSGDVKRKLEVARRALDEQGKNYSANIVALECVQPEPIKASDIAIRIGSSWIKKSYYEQFLCEMLGVRSYYRDGLEIFYNKFDSSYKVNKTDYIRNSTTMNATEIFGTSRASAFRLFEDALNMRETNIFDTIYEDGKEKRVLNEYETIRAREKQNKIKELFKDWIYYDGERREDLENTYNSIFNRIRLAEYDGSHLKFPDMNSAITLRKHQKNAIHRITSGDKKNGNVLLHHVVGSGKTYTICASAMKLKQYGLAKKSMIVVPNHLVQQWAGDFRHLYPNAKLLITSKDDLDKKNRQKFVSRVAMGDYDAVIIAQSQFAKINISPDRQINKIRQELKLIEDGIVDQYSESNFPRGTVKNLERIKKSREATLKKLLDENKKDNVLIFENLGVDYLFVDEAHHYKNKFLYTKMNNVAGISSSASQRASDLELKVEYINELHGGDTGVVFATGTPISNSMTEMYTMQSYLQKSTLAESGLNYFDNWAGDFGETINSLEMSPSGQGYKAKTRFAKFTNLPELLTMYRSFADVQTADMVKLDVPIAERKVVTLKPSETVIDLAEEIADRAEKISRGGVNPQVDNMLKVTSDGKKLALDPRCFDPLSSDEPSSKINSCADNIYRIWATTKENRATQIVFCDLSTPKRDFAEYEYGVHFDVYNDLKHKLVQTGIPSDEIAYIHEAKNDLQKQNMFNAVNSGKIRVLIGSTEKCGAGTNVQKKLIALHHLDTPYRPSDLAQREGRIVRQGNTNENVEIYTYVTERTFDSYSYQILENKQRFISQIDRGNLTIREADDIDETTLSYAEIKAITAANPRIKRKMELDSEATRLRILESQYKKSLYSLQDKIRKTFPEKIQRQTLLLERLKADIDMVKSNFDKENFSINVNGVLCTDRKEGARALTDALYGSKPETIVAEYGGLKLSINPIVMLIPERNITLTGEGKYIMEIGNSASGNLTRLDNFLSEFSQREFRSIENLRQLREDLEIAKEQVQVPFEHKAKLEAVVKDLTEINAELDLNKKEEVILTDDRDNTSEEQYMALPIKENNANAETKQLKRKHLTNELLKAYNQEDNKKTSDYLFIKNGHYYEIFGQKAVDVAFICGENAIEERLLGESISVVSVLPNKLDSIIYKLIENGKQIRILEEFTINEEEDFILQENLEEDFDVDKEFEKVIDELSDEELVEFLDLNVESNYFEDVAKSVSKEYLQFKADMLTKSSTEIFQENYKIRFYEEISCLFEDTSEEAFENDMMYALYKDNDNIIASLYEYFLSKDYMSISNYNDTLDVIKDYCYYNRKEDMDEYNSIYNKMEENKLIQNKDFNQFKLPFEAVRTTYDNSTLFNMPNSSKYSGLTYYLPNNFIQEDSMTDGDGLDISLPKDFKITLHNYSTKEKTVLELADYLKEVEKTNEKDYEYYSNLSMPKEQEKQAPIEALKEESEWTYISVPERAKIASYENSTLFKMPTGDYEGFCYFIPNKLLKENVTKETIRISLANNFIVTVKDNKNERLQALTVSEFNGLVANKDKDDYPNFFSTNNKVENTIFNEIEVKLRKNIPLDMQARDNWVIVRTKKNEESGRLAKFLISPITGKFAESDNPQTWSNFETACEYARKNGGETLAYALDGKDKVACIDVDHCKVDGHYISNIPSEIRAMIDTYSETSISGEGEHFFGKTNGMDLRAFSKDGDLEFYQKSHFIAMTGESVKTKELASFDNPKMSEFLSSKCEKRTMVKGSCQGVSGLSIMSDRDLVEKASSGKHGDTFKSLYEGKDLQNNHSNSDMSLMNRLAFWCNGDKEQMLRIFATSGLFRENKSPDYYEGTALKAIKDTTLRYNPNTNFSNKPTPPKANSSGNGKG